MLAAQGARVAFTYHQGEEVAVALAKELNAGPALRLDLSGPVGSIESVVDAVAEEFGRVDAFIQCAGVAVTMECSGPNSSHRMPAITEAGWDRFMAINVRSTFFACRRLVEVMRRGNGGNMVFTGSIDNVKSVPSPVHYAASKGALASMVQAMSKELGEFGIRVNMVAPGLMAGGISRELPDNLLNEYIKHCGLKRVARVEEIAGLMAWLALENSYITGQTILLDGAL